MTNMTRNNSLNLQAWSITGLESSFDIHTRTSSFWRPPLGEVDTTKQK